MSFGTFSRVSPAEKVNPQSVPKPATATGQRASRWRGLSWSAVILLLVPATILIVGLMMIGYMSPVYSGVDGLDYDPAYPYLFNGAGLMKGYNPGLVEHPGTPVQTLIGLLSVMSWSVATLFGRTTLAFTPSIAADAELYLRVAMTALLVLNCIAVYWVGSAIARSTRLIMAGVACQAAYLLFGPLFPRIIHVAPEAMLCLTATALMAVLAPVLFADEDVSDRRAIAAGFFIGLGVATKVTFFPLVLLTLLLRRRRPIWIAVSASALFTLFFLLPIIGRLKRIFNWLFSIATHEGSHGAGPAGFIDWAVLPERAGLIASNEPLLIVAAVAVMAVLLFTNSGDRRKAVIIAVALGTLVLLVLKHYAIHYLMPVVAIAPAIIVWAISRFAGRQSPYIVATALAAIIGAASIQNMSAAFATERALRRENEKAVAAIIARYQNPLVVGAYRAGHKPLAIVLGLAWSDLKFARLFPEMTEVYTYDVGIRKLWRAHTGPVDWSYLDEVDRAGRAILLVQGRNSRIGPPTARIETLLDQGFGDTVVRIIVSLKPVPNDRP